MTGRSWWVAGASVLLLVSSAVAQTVYTWKDEKGVVHFADESPEGVKNVEKLTLEVPAPLVSEDTGDGDAAAGGEGGEKIAVTPAAGGSQPPPAAAAGQFSGPAEVVFLGAELFVNSSTERKVHGKVRNTGGDPAHKVAVRVVIADGDTGNLCTTGEIEGEPSELGPGETGGFEGLLNTPCFLGNPKITYYPEWD